MFTLDDGFQEPVTLISPHREILGATFYKFVLENIGGSEKFEDKKAFFHQRLRQHHFQHMTRNFKRVFIDREQLLESVRLCLVCSRDMRQSLKFCRPKQQLKIFHHLTGVRDSG